MYTHRCVYVCIHIYIYNHGQQRERERERRASTQHRPWSSRAGTCAGPTLYVVACVYKPCIDVYDQADYNELWL